MLRMQGAPIPCLDLPTPDPECGQCCGGTGAYGRNYSAVAKPFDLGSPLLKRGTLLGMKYRGVSDQGHVAVLLGDGPDAALLQSFAACPGGVEPCPQITYPGLNANLTLAQAHNSLPFCKFTYMVAPEDWLLASQQ